MITQRDLDLIADRFAFNPQPAPVPLWERVVEAVCWVALVVIAVATTVLLWRI